MFCPNCGERNEAGARFCAQCGCKLEEETKGTIQKQTVSKSSKEVLKHIEQLPIKGKQLIGILSVILVISIGIFYKNGSAYDTPQKALQKYQEYSSSQSYGKLYELFDIKESEYVNKNTFIEACQEKQVSTEEMMLEDMKKSDHKRYFFFDQYQLDCMPSGVRVRNIYIPYIKGATLEANGKKIGKDYLNKNKTEYVIRILVNDGMTFRYKNTGGQIKEKEYKVGEQGDDGNYWVNLEYTNKQKEKAKETLRKIMLALKDYAVTTSGSYEDIQQYFATADDAKAFWDRGLHESESERKITKKPEIVGDININEKKDSEKLRLVDAIALELECTYEYETETQGLFNFTMSDELKFNRRTVLMRKNGNEWKLDLTSCNWEY